MDAFELYNETGKPIGIWACGKCRRLTLQYTGDSSRLNTKESAEACCRPRLCECGQVAGEYSSNNECDYCRKKRWQKEQGEKLSRRIAAAEDVTDTYTGPVYCEGFDVGGWGDGYYADISDLLDAIGGEAEVNPPQWAFACTPDVRTIDARDIIEQICDDGYEGMIDFLSPSQELIAACKKFNEDNEQYMTVWHADYERKIQIPTNTPGGQGDSDE